MSESIPALIAEARAVILHPLENRPWRDYVRRLADALESLSAAPGDDEREALIARTIEEHSEVMDYGDGTGYCECGGQATPTGRQPKNGPPFVYWTPEHQAHEVAVALGRLSPLTQEALDLLDELNSSGRIAYDDYSRIHDAVSRFSLLEPAGDEYPKPGTLAYAQARAEADGSLDDDEDGYDGPWLPVEEGTK